MGSTNCRRTGNAKKTNGAPGLRRSVESEIPSAALRAGSSLRLKNGSAQDDTRILEQASYITTTLYGCTNHGVVVSSVFRKFSNWLATFKSPEGDDGCVPSACRSWQVQIQPSLRGSIPLAQ